MFLTRSESETSHLDLYDPLFWQMHITNSSILDSIQLGGFLIKSIQEANQGNLPRSISTIYGFDEWVETSLLNIAKYTSREDDSNWEPGLISLTNVSTSEL